MDEKLANALVGIDEMIASYQYGNAVRELGCLAKDYPHEGIIAYYLGRMSIVGQDDILALKYFQKSTELNYSSAELYLTKALVEKRLALDNEAEKDFRKAEDVAETPEMLWVCMSCFAMYCIEREMYLKAGKITKKMIDLYPNNYQGYHLHIVLSAIKEKYDDVFAYMEKLPDKFKKHPQFLIDVVEVSKRCGRNVFEMFEKNEDFYNIIPQVVLKERVIHMDEGETDSKEALIRTLAQEHHDKESIISLMILEFSRGCYKKSAEFANIVLDNEKEEAGLRYYLALYFQIFNLYYLAEKKPSKELRDWMERAMQWSVNYLQKVGVPEVESAVVETFELIINEINSSNY